MPPYLFDSTQEHLLSTPHSSIPVKKQGCLKRIENVLVAAAAIILIPLIVVSLVLSFVNPLQVAVNGATTQGFFVSRAVGAKGLRSVTYRYVVENVEYVATTIVYSDIFTRVPDLSDFPVFYARNNPQISYIEPVNELQIVCSGGSLFFVIIGAFSALIEVKSRRRGRPAAHQIIPGILLGVNPIKTRGGILWEIHYEFRSPRTHTIIQGQSTSIRRILSDRVIPPNGTELAIIYIDDAVHDPL